VSGIAILTHAGDLHALVVHEALQRRGVAPSLWLTADFPARSHETIVMRRSGRGAGVDGFGYDAVWYRRPAPGDPGEAARAFRGALVTLLRRDGFWVNDPDARTRAEHKPLQQLAAGEVGLATPETLYSNDPAEVRRFVAEHGGSVVYKPLHPAAWSDGAKRWQPATALVSERELLDDDAIALVPAIYQELVPKAYELRVTVIGRRVFAARLDSQATERGRLDWRRAGDEVPAAACTLPAAVEESCLALTRRLGLVFGCIDLIVTPDGTHVFLEINQMGQFLFVERWTGLPLLDAFCELLLQRDPAYDWAPSRVRVRFADVAERAAAFGKRLARDHVALRPRDWTECAGRAS
jgi:glutathione synthase/RimK-type ligase-like ATP-grasp enzyme